MAGLTGKVAVITGASRGIGKGIALTLAGEGATVYVTGRTVEPGSAPLPGTIGETVEQCNERGAASGGKAIGVALDLLDGYDALVLIDAMPMGEAPGTIAVIEPELVPTSSVGGVAPAIDAHSMSPESVLTMLQELGGSIERVRIVGCQPEAVDEGIGLSDAVALAVEPAMAVVHDVLTELFATRREESCPADAAWATRSFARAPASPATEREGFTTIGNWKPATSPCLSWRIRWAGTRMPQGIAASSTWALSQMARTESSAGQGMAPSGKSSRRSSSASSAASPIGSTRVTSSLRASATMASAKRAGSCSGSGTAARAAA